MRLKPSSEDVASRLELNLCWYFKRVLKVAQVPSQVVPTCDFVDLESPVVVTVDAHQSMQSIEAGLMWESMLVIQVFGQIDDVPGKAHKAIVAMLKNAIWPEQRSIGRQLHATAQALAAMNRPPRAVDKRPCARVMVWDLMSPSLSLASENATVNTIIASRAHYSAQDWDGADVYGQ